MIGPLQFFGSVYPISLVDQGSQPTHDRSGHPKTEFPLVFRSLLTLIGCVAGMRRVYHWGVPQMAGRPLSRRTTRSSSPSSRDRPDNSLEKVDSGWSSNTERLQILTQYYSLFFSIPDFRIPTSFFLILPFSNLIQNFLSPPPSSFLPSPSRPFSLFSLSFLSHLSHCHFGIPL